MDLLKIIQLGLAFSDKAGVFAPGCPCWQFNFKFSLASDMFAQDSIDLLVKSGISFEDHQERGIDPLRFGELIMSSGLVLDEKVVWTSFHSGYDYGYVQERSEWRQAETRDARRSSRDEQFKTREKWPKTRYERPKRFTSGLNALPAAPNALHSGATRSQKARSRPVILCDDQRIEVLNRPFRASSSRIARFEPVVPQSLKAQMLTLFSFRFFSLRFASLRFAPPPPTSLVPPHLLSLTRASLAGTY